MSTAGEPTAADTAPYWRTAQWWRRAGMASSTLWAATAVAFLGTLIAARGLGPDSYGLVVLALSAGVVLTTFLDISLEDALVYFGARKVALGEPGLRPLFRFALRLDVALGVAVTAALLLAAGPIAALVTDGKLSTDLMRLGLLAAAVMTIDGTTGAALVVARRPDLRGWAQLTRAALRVAFILPAVAWGEAATVLWAIVAASAGGSLLQGYLAWSAGWRRWPVESDRRTPTGRFLRFAALTSLTGSLAAASTAVLPLLLAQLFEPRSVGLFAVAATPLLFAGLLSAPIRLAVLPEQTARLAEPGRGTARRDLARLVAVAVGVSVVTVGAGWLLLPIAVPLLFGAEYQAAVPLAMLVVVGVLGVNITSAAKLFVLAAGRPGVRTAMAAVDLAAVLGFVVVAAELGGLRGAAAGYAAALVAVSFAWCAAALLLRAPSLPRPPVAPAGDLP